MRNITNDYRDAKVLHLGSASDLGPYLVTQTGVDPAAQIPKTRMFILRPDGCWVDFNAYACKRNPEAMDELVFSTMKEVIAAFGRLTGRPRVLNLPVDEAGLKGWLEEQKGRDPLEAAHAWAVKYKERFRAHH